MGRVKVLQAAIYSYMFFIFSCRQSYKKPISILPLVAPCVNRPLGETARELLMATRFTASHIQSGFTKRRDMVIVFPRIAVIISSSKFSR